MESAIFLHPIDVKVKFDEIMAPFVSREIAAYDLDWIVLASCSSYIPRLIYDIVIKMDDVQSFFDVLEERQSKRVSARSSHSNVHSEMDQNTRTIFKRLVTEGLTFILLYAAVTK